jgi:hypothetical protein
LLNARFNAAIIIVGKSVCHMVLINSDWLASEIAKKTEIEVSKDDYVSVVIEEQLAAALQETTMLETLKLLPDTWCFRLQDFSASFAQNSTLKTLDLDLSGILCGGEYETKCLADALAKNSTSCCGLFHCD